MPAAGPYVVGIKPNRFEKKPAYTTRKKSKQEHRRQPQEDEEAHGVGDEGQQHMGTKGRVVAHADDDVGGPVAGHA